MPLLTNCLTALACGLLAATTSCSGSTDVGRAGTTTTPASAPSTSQAPGPQLDACAPTDYEFPNDLYPFDDRCIDLGFGDYHYFDELPSSAPRGIALMVHGNPVSSFVYRDVAQQLLERGYRVVAVDHYGFGMSAKPSTDVFGYRPSDHSRVLTEFVDALDLEDVTLLVQDWGGPVGLGMAVERPDRVKNILVMNTWAWQVTEADHDGPFGALTRWSQVSHDQGEEFVANGAVIFGAAAGLAAPYEPPLDAAIMNAYLGPFFDSETGLLRSATVAVPTTTFAQSILDDRAMFETLGDLEPIASKPVFFYIGGQDPLFGALTPNPDGTCAIGSSDHQEGGTHCVDADGAFVYPYVDHFRSLWDPEMVTGVEINTSANHFIQEQAPERVAEIVDALNEAG